MKKTLLTLSAIAMLAVGANAAAIFNNFGETYTQNFATIDGDNTTGNAVVLPADWAATGESVIYRGTSTTSSTGGVYGYNSETAGYLPSGTADNLQFTLALQNSTGGTITSLSLSYLAEQWRGVSGRANGWTVSIDIAGGGFNPITGLDYTANSDASLKSAQTLSNTSVPVSILDGQAFSIRWSGDRGTGSGSSQGISIDDVSITIVPEPTTFVAVLGGLGLMGMLRRRKA